MVAAEMPSRLRILRDSALTTALLWAKPGASTLPVTFDDAATLRIPVDRTPRTETLAAELKKVAVESAIEADEEHSAFSLTYHDSTNGLRRIGIELSQQPEYRKFRLLSKQIAKLNQPPFSVVKNDHRDSIANWRLLLDHIKAEGKRDASVQRYKGLGEMNAEQLADTTMDPEKRTLLSVRLEDVVATDLIFTTLMGEDVENRRRFIEENALDVKNLDV